MESKTQSPYPDNADAKAAFRKPSNDAANRKYRRRSPVSGSSSSDGSPTREHSSSPIYSRDNSARDSDLLRRNDDRRDVNRDSGRSHRSRSGDSYRNSDRHSYRSSHDYHRRDDHVRQEKYIDGTRRESEHYKSRDSLRGDDKYSRYRSDGPGNRSRDKDKGDRDGRDEKREYRRSLEDHKGDLSPVYEENWRNQNDSTSRRDGAKHRSKEASNSDPREFDGQKHAKEEKKKYGDRETSRHKDRYKRSPGYQFEDKSGFTNENQEFSAKKPKLVSLGTDHGKADERLPSSTKEAQKLVGKVTSEEAPPAKGSDAADDFDAAKIAAMKAAELVNKNLVGTGYMSTDQKKKLLWGNKKNADAEESGHRWDATLFPDRERQEKFNKLMSLRLRMAIVGCEMRGESTTGSQTGQSRKQWRTSGEADGTTTVRFGEAVHCWASSQRWTHCWTRSLSNLFRMFLYTTFNFVHGVCG